jgi:hypothetical protein
MYANNVLIASSFAPFVQRFTNVFDTKGWTVIVVGDGYKALSLLEEGRASLLLVDGFPSNNDLGNSGFHGHCLSSMWRQVEGRDAKLLIGCVSDTDYLPAQGRARVKSDAEDLASNRGIDHHFWNDESDDHIYNELWSSFSQRMQSVLDATARFGRII